MSETTEKFSNFLRIVSRLRAPDGCPWDQKQTPQTFKTYVIEEAHELLEAIDADDPQHIREELGDMLFQIIFLTNLYQEKNLFSLDEVVETISEKMIRRHPHVFGDETITSEQELRKKWHAIKSKENPEKAKEEGLLASLPKSLPALRRAQRVSERAARSGFEWPDIHHALGKIEEEVAELKKALATGEHEKIFEEAGDLLFSMVTICRLANTSSEDALSAATEKFIRRFAEMEKMLQDDGRTFTDLNTESLLDIWKKSKQRLTK